MGLITKLGNWLDRQAETKVTKPEMISLLDEFSVLRKRMEMNETALQNAHLMLDKTQGDLLKLRDELTAIKAMSKILGTRNPNPSQRFDGSEAWKR